MTNKIEKDINKNKYKNSKLERLSTFRINLKSSISVYDNSQNNNKISHPMMSNNTSTVSTLDFKRRISLKTPNFLDLNTGTPNLTDRPDLKRRSTIKTDNLLEFNLVFPNLTDRSDLKRSISSKTDNLLQFKTGNHYLTVLKRRTSLKTENILSPNLFIPILTDRSYVNNTSEVSMINNSISQVFINNEVKFNKLQEENINCLSYTLNIVE